MWRNLQILISLLLVVSGTFVSAFSAGHLSVRTDCDERYKAFVQSPEMIAFFAEKGLADYYQSNFPSFRPSGRMYSGSNESGLFIVGGAAVALFGIAGILDSLRRKKYDLLARRKTSTARNQDKNSNRQRDAIPAEGAERVCLHVAQQPFHGDEGDNRRDDGGEQN